MSNQEIQEKHIPLSKRHYITISSIIAVFLWAIGATYFVLQYIEVNPLRQKNHELSQSLNSVTSKNQSLQNELDNLKQSYNQLQKNISRPTLIYPPNESSLIGGRIAFRWDYRDHTSYQKYILEIRNITHPGSEVHRYNVLNPEQKLMNFPISILSEPPYGEYVWRIKPGQLLQEDKEIVHGPASQYSSFFLDPSVIERIKRTAILRVGTSLTFTGYFNILSTEGNLEGFDIDLIRWIAGKLRNKLDVKQPLKVEFLDTPWKMLLPNLRRFEVDLVISAMTSIRKREEDFRGIKFTKGYIQSHSIFVHNGKIDKSYPDGLKGRRVGVAEETTNEKAAHFLKNKFGFKINNSFKAYADIYRGLIDGNIDFGLVDNILVLKYLKNKEFIPYGPSLDKELELFYKEEFGRDSEKYAIAVVEEPRKEEDLLKLIDKILESDEGQEKLKELTKKWLQSNKPK